MGRVVVRSAITTQQLIARRWEVMGLLALLPPLSLVHFTAEISSAVLHIFHFPPHFTALFVLLAI